MKKRPIRKNIYHIVRINIVLFIILIICGCIYLKNNANIKNNDSDGNDKIEEVFSDIDDRITDFPKGQVSNLAGDSSSPANEDQSNTTDGEPTVDVNSDDKLTESEELALYSDLPCFINENTERYINYKKQNPDYSYEQVITYVNIGLDYDYYENVNTIDNVSDLTVLVNKYNKLPDDYKPDLVQVDPSICVSYVGPQYLQKEALDAFVKMHQDAKQLGLNITVYSAYRSIETQDLIWNNAIKSGRTLQDVDSSIARAGHSEHHTGLSIDVISVENSVEETEEFKWYSENAHKYGFIIRYPKGKENITGYKYEPWHLRYVGPEIAKDVYEMGITYDEYYVQVLQPQKNLQNINKTP